MQMNVRNTLNGVSCIGIKTVPEDLGKTLIVLRSALPSVFYPLLNAHTKNGILSLHT